MTDKRSDQLDDLLKKYVEAVAKTKADMTAKLFSVFVETTGHRPEDLCLVEERIRDGLEFKTIFYFDWKHRHQTVGVPE